MPWERVGQNAFRVIGKLDPAMWKELLDICETERLQQVAIQWRSGSSGYAALHVWVAEFRKRGIEVSFLDQSRTRWSAPVRRSEPGPRLFGGVLHGGATYHPPPRRPLP